MLKSLTIALALLAAIPGSAVAAGMLSDQVPTDLRTNLADPSWGFYVQGYGGVVTDDMAVFQETFIDSDDPVPIPESFSDTLNTGPAFGVSAGVTTPIDGLSIGLDVMHTSATFSGFFAQGNATLDTLSVMATVEEAYHLTPQFDLYASAGLGATNFHFVGVTDVSLTTDTNGWAPAYQVAVGARTKLTENLSIFAELKHQDTIAPASITLADEDDGPQQATITKANNALLVGARFNFD